MAGKIAEPANLDPYVKPKPGNKVSILFPTISLVLITLRLPSVLNVCGWILQPKATTLPDPAPSNARSANIQAQRHHQAPFAPPPAHQQKLILCRYYEAGKAHLNATSHLINFVILSIQLLLSIFNALQVSSSCEMQVNAKEVVPVGLRMDLMSFAILRSMQVGKR